MTAPAYDRSGVGYSEFRRADPRYGYLRETPELDVGLRLVTSELS